MLDGLWRIVLNAEVVFYFEDKADDYAAYLLWFLSYETNEIMIKGVAVRVPINIKPYVTKLEMIGLRASV